MNLFLLIYNLKLALLEIRPHVQPEGNPHSSGIVFQAIILIRDVTPQGTPSQDCPRGLRLGRADFCHSQDALALYDHYDNK